MPAQEFNYYDPHSSRLFFEEFLRTGEISGVDTKSSDEVVLVRRICEGLNESKVALIQAVVNTIGAQEAKELLNQTLEVGVGLNV